jgi:tryptophan synthase alpha chain
VGVLALRLLPVQLGLRGRPATQLNRLEETLRGLRDQRRAGLVPFVTAGYPDLATSARLLPALAGAGAVAIELGVPFSDPLADGPALQQASQVALDRGVSMIDVLALARDFRAAGHATPLVAMTYANPVLAYGAARFAQDARAAGIDGVIVSDLPPEERADVWDALSAAGLATIPLVAPTTSPARLPRLLARASGFVYLLSRTGVTGDGAAFADELDALVAAVRAGCDLPVGIGFGVTDAAKARFVAERAEAVIVGAAIARVIERGGDVVANVGDFVRGLSEAIRK